MDFNLIVTVLLSLTVGFMSGVWYGKWKLKKKVSSGVKRMVDMKYGGKDWDDLKPRGK